MRITLLILLVFIAACRSGQENIADIYISGNTNVEEEYLIVGMDTIDVENGTFSDTITRDKDQYNYLLLGSWKWPKIVYLKSGENININFQEEWIQSDVFNNYLLNKDSILIPYTARWDMNDSVYRATWKKEFPINIDKINNYFSESNTPTFLIDELKQMEYMLRGHLTANFISFQERKDNEIDRDIYDFVKEIDLNNQRLGFHENNRNFQYYYYLDKVGEIPDTLFPFAVIDTANKYVKIDGIRNMIIRSAVKSGLYTEEVDHDALFQTYKENVKVDPGDDSLLKVYNQIQKLKPGNIAPKIGVLESLNGDMISMNELKGQNILITAWGTWCPYCAEELPHLKRLMGNYPSKFVSVAISLDSDTDEWKNYINNNKWSGTHLIDKKRRSTFRNNYLIGGTNKYYLIDKNGKIISGSLKPSSQEFEELIKNLD